MNYLIVIFVMMALTVNGQRNRLPPPGMAAPEAAKAELMLNLKKLRAEIDGLKLPDLYLRYIPDAELYEKAVRFAVENDEFYTTNEFRIAAELLEEGKRRVAAMATSQFDWISKTGPVVIGYASKIDHSVQPVGVVVPPTFKAGQRKEYRLDVWLHGRDDKLTELKFINERQNKLGEFVPEDTFVVHPYGRYCNAFKFAGEVDVFEAIEAVIDKYPIDRSRIVLRGFSMGGAGVWHLAAHHPTQWLVAAPGAGFAETAQYLKLDRAKVPWYEQKLWGWYDATDYAANLYNTRVVAYSGELDKQKQAADIMEQHMGKAGIPMIHLIGPRTEHKYELETKKLLSKVVDSLAVGGTIQNEIRFTTKTLRYPGTGWIQIMGMEKHWEPASVTAHAHGILHITTTNVTAVAITPPFPHFYGIRINDQTVKAKPENYEPIILVKKERWELGSFEDFNKSLKKRPGIQGPIDDAFMDSFIFVTPSKLGMHTKTHDWINKELARANFEWRAQFRGDVRIKKDTEITTHDLQHANLILWGDPASNQMLARIANQLPLKWEKNSVQLGQQTFASDTHVPLLIYPNPLNRDRYVVLNSCFTFRGFGSNASQTPKLPDYAIIDIADNDPLQTGMAVAGFFNEAWSLSGSN